MNRTSGKASSSAKALVPLLAILREDAWQLCRIPCCQDIGCYHRPRPWNSEHRQYAPVAHSDNMKWIICAYAADCLDESKNTMIGSTFSENSRWGFPCNDSRYPDNVPGIIDDSGNSFSNNTSGHVDHDCSVLQTSISFQKIHRFRQQIFTPAKCILTPEFLITSTVYFFGLIRHQDQTNLRLS